MHFPRKITHHYKHPPPINLWQTSPTNVMVTTITTIITHFRVLQKVLLLLLLLAKWTLIQQPGFIWSVRERRNDEGCSSNDWAIQRLFNFDPEESVSGLICLVLQKKDGLLYYSTTLFVAFKTYFLISFAFLTWKQSLPFFLCFIFFLCVSRDRVLWILWGRWVHKYWNMFHDCRWLSSWVINTITSQRSKLEAFLQKMSFQL